MHRKRNAKIVATLGPASSAPELIQPLFEAGVDVFRLNFSHGTQDDHEARYRAIRAVEQKAGRPIGILQDLQGPKIRIGTLPSPPVTARAAVRPCASRSRRSRPTRANCRCRIPEVFRNILPGHVLMIDDGKLRLEVVGLRHRAVRRARRGRRQPDATARASTCPTPTCRSRRSPRRTASDLAFGLSLGVDWIALSFVQRPADIIEAQALIEAAPASWPRSRSRRRSSASTTSSRWSTP